MPGCGPLDHLLTRRRLAQFGVSTYAGDISRLLMRTLIARGLDVVPIRAGVATIEGRTAYARLEDVPGPVEAALVMLPPLFAERAIRACAARGVLHVWLHPGMTPGGATAYARLLLEAQRIGLDAFLSDEIPGVGRPRRARSARRGRIGAALRRLTVAALRP